MHDEDKRYYYGIDYDNIHVNLTEVDEYWGSEMPNMCIEEFAELIQAINKVRRNKGDARDNMCKEIADCYISLYALMKYYDIAPEYIEELMNKKVTKSYTSEAEKDALRTFIESIFGDNCVRQYNALVRSGINSLEKLSIDIRKPNWWKNVRGLGKDSAKKISQKLQPSL